MMMSSIKTVRIVIYSTSHAEFYKIGIDLNSVFSLLFYGELDQYENIIEDKKYYVHCTGIHSKGRSTLDDYDRISARIYS